MTRRIGDTIIIEPEPPAPCENCGEVEELRPYGPNGQRICFDCGQKIPGTQERFNALHSGIANVKINLPPGTPVPPGLNL